MKWTDADEAYLREQYPHAETRAVAQTLGRSFWAVQQRAQRLGLSKSQEQISADRARAAKCATPVVKHGHANPTDPTYTSWWSMRQRCEDPKHKSYAGYGGRGIAVAAEWQDFACFLLDMGVRPAGTTLGRIDNEKGYGPGNCRWETMEEQQNNRRSSRFLEAFGKRQTVTQWAREFGIPRDTFSVRLKLGWPIEKALTTPLRQQTRRCGIVALHDQPALPTASHSESSAVCRT